MIIRRCSTKGAFEVIPEVHLKFNDLKKRFKVNFEIPNLIMFDYSTYSISCYKSGKILIKNCNSEEEANEIVEVLYNE